MRPIIYSLIFMSIGSVCFAGNCCNNSCGRPITKATKSVLNFTGKVVSAPFRTINNTTTRIQENRNFRKNSVCR